MSQNQGHKPLTITGLNATFLQSDVTLAVIYEDIFVRRDSDKLLRSSGLLFFDWRNGGSR